MSMPAGRKIGTDCLRHNSFHINGNKVRQICLKKGLRATMGYSVCSSVKLPLRYYVVLSHCSRKLKSLWKWSNTPQSRTFADFNFWSGAIERHVRLQHSSEKHDSRQGRVHDGVLQPSACERWSPKSAYQQFLKGQQGIDHIKTHTEVFLAQ